MDQEPEPITFGLPGQTVGGWKTARRFLKITPTLELNAHRRGTIRRAIFHSLTLAATQTHAGHEQISVGLGRVGRGDGGEPVEFLPRGIQLGEDRGMPGILLQPAYKLGGFGGTQSAIAQAEPRGGGGFDQLGRRSRIGRMGGSTHDEYPFVAPRARRLLHEIVDVELP